MMLRLWLGAARPAARDLSRAVQPHPKSPASREDLASTAGELCAAGAPDRGEDVGAERYLLYQPQFGLSNQIVALRNAVVWALLLNRTLVLPHLLGHGIGAAYPRFVASSSCQYLRPFAFPSDVDVALRVARVGASSASYEIGIFPVPAAGEPAAAAAAAAVGTFVHVYVDADGRPTPICETVRGVLDSLVVA